MADHRKLDDVYHLADSLGLVVSSFDMDGEWHRVPIDGKKKGNLSGAYCLSEFVLRSGDRVIVGMLCNWASGRDERLTLEGVAGATPEEIAEAKQRARAQAEASKKQRAQLQAATADRAADIFNKLPDSGRSPYLDTKSVKAWGVRFSRGSIVVPARDVPGKIWTLQFIDPEGNKRFLTGGAKRGRFHLIGSPEGASLIGVAEGYATAASIFEALAQRFPIAVAFDAGNILPVCAALRAVYPAIRMVIFADHDIHKGYPQAFIKQSEVTDQVRDQIGRLARLRPDVQVDVVADDDPRLRDRDKHHNTGVAKAILAAAAVNGDVLIPRFNNDKEAAA